MFNNIACSVNSKGLNEITTHSHRHSSKKSALHNINSHGLIFEGNDLHIKDFLSCTAQDSVAVMLCHVMFNFKSEEQKSSQKFRD